MATSPTLSEAIQGRNLELVKSMMVDGVDVNQRSKDGSTPLRNAAVSGQLEIVKLLLQRRATIEITDRYGKTALYKAAWAGHVDVVEFLLTKGASINAQGSDGRTPLHWAAIRGNMAMTALLLDHGALPNAIDRPNRQTPLNYATAAGFTEVADLLVARGASLDTPGSYRGASSKKPNEVDLTPTSPSFPYHGANAGAPAAEAAAPPSKRPPRSAKPAHS